MRINFNKAYLFAIAIILSPMTFGSNNYFDKKESCLKVSDIQDIQDHFEQFQRFTKTASDKICRDKVGDKWFDIIRTTLAMQRLSVTDELGEDLDDDLTLRPIGNKDWWTYFTQRADQFIVEPSNCDVSEHIVAFVRPFFRGTINLCPLFFKLETPGQIETLMHEVRHFDGHSHVTCTQGNEIGTRGACDQRIKSGGSYAVSVQANIELSYVDQLNFSDRVLAEAQAIYSANNKFNSLPTIKATDFIYASNEDGEVWRIPRTKPEEAQLVKKLDDPSYIYGNGSLFTVYPVDTKKEAYRVSKKLTTKVDVIGAFAVNYNDTNEEERIDFQAISYYGLGAIAKSNQLNVYCGTQSTTMKSVDFDHGNIQALPTFKNDKGEDHMFILAQSGELFNLTCDEDTGKLAIEETTQSLPNNIESAFSFDQQTAFVVTTSGTLMSYDLKNKAYNNEEISKKTNWLNATPLKVYSVFDNDLK